MAAITAADPFPDAHPSRLLVYFYDRAPPDDLIGSCRNVNGERLSLGTRELYVDYGEGIRFTKLKIPALPEHTSRSINSVRKMAVLMGA
jgi:uncharacterized protein (DUF1697 family)